MDDWDLNDLKIKNRLFTEVFGMLSFEFEPIQNAAME